MNESGLSRVKINIAIMMTCLILSFLLMKCDRDSTPNSSTLDDSDILSNDLFEPNNSRPQAYKLEPLPYLNLEGVLLSRNDIDWFKLSITGKDTCNIKAIFDMERMTEKLAIEGCFYGETESPKGCFYLHKGLDSDGTTTLGWQCTPGNYYFYIKIDSTSQIEAGKYSFDLKAIP